MKRISGLLVLFLVIMLLVFSLKQKYEKKLKTEEVQETQNVTTKTENLNENDKRENNVTYNISSNNIVITQYTKNKREKREKDVKKEKSKKEKIEEKIKREFNKINLISDKKKWFIERKKLIKKYCDVYDPPESIYNFYSKEELDLLFRVVQAEIGDYTFEQKCNVVSVIFNRINHNEFPDTMFEVLTADQFATISNGRIYLLMSRTPVTLVMG